MCLRQVLSGGGGGEFTRPIPGDGDMDQLCRVPVIKQLPMEGTQFSILYPRNRDLHIFNLSKIQIFSLLRKFSFSSLQFNHLYLSVHLQINHIYFSVHLQTLYMKDWFVYHLKKLLKKKLCHDN